MQPVQLSLIPDPASPPPATLIAQLPDRQIAVAVTLLADLIARAAGRDVAAPAETGVGDE